MLKKQVWLSLLVIVLCCGVGLAAGAAVCDDECTGDGCDYIGEGDATQYYFNRCQNQNQCGSYDPYAYACVKTCEWNTYECETGWPYYIPYECNHITSYDEDCSQVQ